jgi:hypothetical protein
VEGTEIHLQPFSARRRARNIRSGSDARGLAGRPRRTLAVAGAVAVAAALSVPATMLGGTALASTVAPARAAAAGPTLKLSASSGRPGQTVSFAGGGFRAGESVALHWLSARGTQLVKVKAGRGGTIAGRFQIPLPRAGVAPRAAVVAVGAASKRQGKAFLVQSCGDEWTGLKGGNWSDGKDWSTGAAPGGTTAACITLAGAKSYTVTLNQLTGSITLGHLLVGAAGGKTSQTLEMDANGSDQYLALAGPSTIYAHGVFRLTSAGNGSDFIQGPGTLDNYGLFATVGGKGWSRYLTGNITNEPSGTVSIAAGSLPGGNTYQESGSTFVNKGTFTVAKGSEYLVTQSVFTQAGGRIVNNGLVQISNASVNKTGGTSTGNAWQFYNNGILHDKAGTGAYEFFNSGELSGTIAAGQTVTVDGDASTDVQLMLSGNVTNDGTLVMTSSTANGGGGNSWLFPLTGTPTLFNNGLIKTLTGVGWTRYFNVNVVNNAVGTMDLDANSNQLNGSWTITNRGTLNVGAGGVLNLDGTTYGNANLTEVGPAKLGVVVGPTIAKSSTINQYLCSAGACQKQAITLSGTLHITTNGTPAGTSVPIYSQQDAVAGTFTTVTPAGWGVAYNQATSGVPNATILGDVVLSAPL